MSIVKPAQYAILEYKANEIIFAITKTERMPDKKDVLTPWKIEQLTRREVLTPAPDPSVHKGTLGRAYVPGRLNSREGLAGLRRTKPAPLQAWLEYQGHNVQSPGVGLTCSGHHETDRPQNCTRGCRSSR